MRTSGEVALLGMVGRGKYAWKFLRQYQVLGLVVFIAPGTRRPCTPVASGPNMCLRSLCEYFDVQYTKHGTVMKFCLAGNRREYTMFHITPIE